MNVRLPFFRSGNAIPLLLSAVLLALIAYVTIRSFEPAPMVIPIEEATLAYPTSTLAHFYTKRFIGDLDHPGITLNTLGFNERFDYSIAKPDGVFRIVALGDSNTYGYGVATVENWTERLEDDLNRMTSKTCPIERFEVINLGMPGYDIEYAAERFFLQGALYKPDLILWLVSAGDFNTRRELEMEKLESVRLKAGGTNATYEIRTLIDEIWTEHHPEELIDYQASGLITLAQKFGGPVALLSNQGQREVFPVVPASVLKTSGIHYLGIIALSDDEHISDEDFHPNAAGHTRIGTEFRNRLMEQSLIPCPD